MTVHFPRDSARVHPPSLFPFYKSTIKRAPKLPLIILPHTETELTGPAYGHEVVQPGDSDLTTQHEGTLIGQRIIVSGRVLDEDGRPVPNVLLEIWQANAAGRYVHVNDQHDAPLDPNLSGAGRVVTDADGRYRFITIKPGAYSWQNHENAWRPAHIHFSLFGPSFLSRIVTQMYFPDDFSISTRCSHPSIRRHGSVWYRVSRWTRRFPNGNWVSNGTSFCAGLTRPRLSSKMSGITPSPTVGPFYAYCLTPGKYPLHAIFTNDMIVPGLDAEKIRIEGRVLDGDNVGIPDAMVEIWQADAEGGFAHARDHQGANTGFKGFGRIEPDNEGKYHFVTIKPGRVKGPEGRLQAPHIDVAVFARGMLKHLVTRIYFGDEDSNKEDPVLGQVPDDRRKTLPTPRNRAGKARRRPGTSPTSPGSRRCSTTCWRPEKPIHRFGLTA